MWFVVTLERVCLAFPRDVPFCPRFQYPFTHAFPKFFPQYHPSMGYYNAPGMAPPNPMSVEAMMYGMGAPPGGGQYVDYEAMYRELQLRMYAQQQQQASGMNRGSPHGQPHQPPLPPGGMGRPMPPSGVSGQACSPGQHGQHLPLTQEALYQYQAMQMNAAGYDEGGSMGTWEEGDEEDGSVATDGSKQSVARRRHARRRRQLARLAQDKMEWEARSRQMEAALLEKGGAVGVNDPNASPALFADFRKALAHALLITEEAVERESIGPNFVGSEQSNTETEGHTAASDELASRLIDELRETESDTDDAANEDAKRTSIDGDGDLVDEGNEAGEESGPRRARSFERRRASFLSSDAPAVHSVSFQNYLGSFERDENTGFMRSQTAKSAFDDRVVGMEAVVALEHGLLKAQASGIFSRGELLITAVSTKDMLTCYAGGGCADVLGANSLDLLHTSLLDGIHVEDVRNLVFAFHLFPTILPEVINTTHSRRDSVDKGNEADEVAGDGNKKLEPAGWAMERAKIRAATDGMLPLPDAAQLLPHGYLRRRMADGRGGFVAVERLGGMIISNDTAAAVLEDMRKPSVQEMSVLYEGGNVSPENNPPPEQRTHSLSSLEVPQESPGDRRRTLARRDAGVDALGGGGNKSDEKNARPVSLDETKPGLASIGEGAKEKIKESVLAKPFVWSYAPATERPYPGLAEQKEQTNNTTTLSPEKTTVRTSVGDVIVNKYHPSNKREAKPGSVGVGRSAVSAPGGRGLSEAALSPSASSFVAASAQSMSSRQPAPPSSAPPTSTVEAAAKAKAEREEASGAQTANEKPTENNDTAVPEKETPASIPPQQTTVDGAVLNKYQPSKKRDLVPGAQQKLFARSQKSAHSQTTEAELSSLVAHCVRHTEKKYPPSGGVPSDSEGRKNSVEELPEGIKDVLRRLTGETFSEHTVLVTIERVRGIGGFAGSEARHNAQMMVVSKLLNDLATRRHKAMSSAVNSA